MVGKEAPSDLPRCCSLLLPCYPARELHQELCRAGSAPAGVGVPAAGQLWPWDTAQHPQHAGCWQHGEGMWQNPRPTHLVWITVGVRAALSSCSASTNVASVNPWWNSKITLQAKATRLSSRVLGIPCSCFPVLHMEFPPLIPALKAMFYILIKLKQKELDNSLKDLQATSISQNYSCSH